MTVKITYEKNSLDITIQDHHDLNVLKAWFDSVLSKAEKLVAEKECHPNHNP